MLQTALKTAQNITQKPSLKTAQNTEVARKTRITYGV